MAAVYAMPAILLLAGYWRGPDHPPGRATYLFCTSYPLLVVALATLVFAADFGLIYPYVVRRLRRVPVALVAVAYALAAFVFVVLVVSAAPSASIAWRDYSIRGATAGFTVLLLMLAFEMFFACLLACQATTLARRLRRLARAPAAARN